MDENIAKAVSFFSITIILMYAFSLFFVLFGKGNELISKVNRKITDRGSVYITENNPVSGNETVVPGAFIIGSIKNGLESDISVNSVVLRKTDEISMLDLSLIDISAVYKAEYIFDSSGKVTLIKYRITGGDS